MDSRAPTGRYAISGFILLGVFLFVLRVAEDRYLISHLVESSLIFLACVTALTLTVFGCIRVVNSRTIRIALLFLLLAICTELILSVTGRIDAWNEIPIIGWRSEIRSMLKNLFFAYWFGGGLMLLYLLLRTNKYGLMTTNVWSRISDAESKTL